ncbi:Iron-sulfur cluster assembly 1-like protein, mitochondrial, partial [Bos mutus]
ALGHLDREDVSSVSPGHCLSKRTPSEVSKIKQLLKDKPEDFPADKPEHIVLKVGVPTRGCNGLPYMLEYTKTKGNCDEEIAQGGVRLFLKKKAQLALLETETDDAEDTLFMFNNPNIKGRCGCRESLIF